MVSPQAREEGLQSAILNIPLESIENSFTENIIINAAELDVTPYIVANSRDYLTIVTGDEITTRGSFLVGVTSFEIYRVERTSRWEGLRKKHGFGLLRTTEEVQGLKTEFLCFASIVENIASDMGKSPVKSSKSEFRISERLLT